MLPSDQHISCSLDSCRANSRPRVSGVSVLADFVQGLLHMLGMEQPVASSNTLWLDNHAEINTACQKSWKATGDHTMELIETVILQCNLWRSWCLRPVYESFLHLMSFQISMFHELRKCDVKNTRCPRPVSFWCFIKSALWLCLSSTCSAACDHFGR